MLMTKESADKMRCPMQLNGTGTCVGPGCAMWRWIPVDTVTDEFSRAVAKVAAETGDKDPRRTKSIAAVRADPGKYGLPTEPTVGYCGLAGKPLEAPTILGRE